MNYYTKIHYILEKYPIIIAILCYKKNSLVPSIN